MGLFRNYTADRPKYPEIEISAKSCFIKNSLKFVINFEFSICMYCANNQPSS